MKNRISMLLLRSRNSTRMLSLWKAISKHLLIHQDRNCIRKSYKATQSVTPSINRGVSPTIKVELILVEKLETLSPELKAFSEIAGQLEGMKIDGKVDLNVLPKFEYLIDRMKKLEGGWTSTGKMRTADAFVLYHAIRNLRLVLSATEQRLATSKKVKGDNPQVVDDSLEVLPYASGLFATVLFVKDQPIDHGIRTLLMEKVRNLRSVAGKASLLPSIEKESAGVDQKLLDKSLHRLASDVQEIISET